MKALTSLLAHGWHVHLSGGNSAEQAVEATLYTPERKEMVTAHGATVPEALEGILEELIYQGASYPPLTSEGDA